ncbi:MAG: nucleoside triphosphate pyrophosphohydrolase [Nevskiaceae bacterium]|jgi:MazG family protein|nr:nucleoside triphosphate pyrophosphohydrolase [Nevskiaceae bacterium]
MSGADSSPQLSAMRQLLQIMQRLRDPQHGCPWDRAQDERSLSRYTLEEAYELVDALECGDVAARRDELGDLLFQVVFLAQLGAERGEYDFEAVARGIADKLVRRHPHVFAADDDPRDQNDWEAIKAAERAARGERGLLDGIPRAAPALLRAAKVGKRAAQVGFDWNDAEGVYAKIAEELNEVQQAQRSGEASACEEEIGDLLLAVTSLARHLHVDPETALRRAVDKFQTRFTAMETQVREQGSTLEGHSAEQLDALWRQAKKACADPEQGL